MVNNNQSLRNFLAGFAGGITLSILVSIGLLLFRYSRNAYDVPVITEASIVVFSSATPKTTSNETRLLDEAELALNFGEPEKVKVLLYPAIENWTSTEELIRGYKLLGQAELMQGHAQLSVPYFNRLYFYEPSAENLFLLATAYDMGGDNKNALEKYQNLANWENLPAEIDIEFVNMRIEGLSRTLGTPVPTP